MALPAQLSGAVSSRGPIGITLVVGAGCSMEAPTSLPSADQCAQETFQALVDQHLLEPGDVADPGDLPAVADASFHRHHDQEIVVNRMHRRSFQYARANGGYLEAVALMHEGVIAQILTLNFDLAINSALAELSAEDVGTVQRPEDYPHASPKRVVYAHGNATLEAEQWLLRSQQIESAWRNTWAQALAQAAMTNPCLIFAGLGSSAPIIRHCIAFLRERLDAQAIFQADPAPFGTLAFTQELGITEDHYIQKPWVAFMLEVSGVLLQEHFSAIKGAAMQLVSEKHCGQQPLESIIATFEKLGLARFGQLCASWFLSKRRYLCLADHSARVVADICLAIGLMCSSGMLVEPYQGSYLLLYDCKGKRLALHAICGQGALSTRNAHRLARSKAMEFSRYGTTLTPVYLANGVIASPSDLPEPIVDDRKPDDILATAPQYVFTTVEALRAEGGVAMVLGKAC